MKRKQHDDASVLLVDDQPAKLLSYQAILSDLDITLVTANSASEALDQLLKRAFAVVLVDVCMPELDGFELATMIRDHPRFRETAIIFVSGVHLTDLDRLRGYKVGAVDYVPVPIVPEILRAKVNIFVDLFRKTRQLERLNRDLEKRVAARTAELEEAGRRKDEFLAVLAHELRNPLAAIRTASEVISLPELQQAQVAQAASIVHRQVSQLTRLIDDLVDVSRITRGAIGLHREVVEVATIVAQAVEASRPVLDARRHLLVQHVPDHSLRVRGDHARLSQVVGNLLNNAAKFTPPGGHITLDVDRQGSKVAIRVTDDGVGIDAESLPRVFELFTQVGRSLDRGSAGLGIGLALVRRLVEMHHGHVTLHSDGLGLGTDVVVTLPLVGVTQGVATLAGTESEASPSVPACRILVADDNADAAESLALMLRMWGHDVRIASDGVEALELAEQFSPRIALLDLGMPNLNGYDTARRLREQQWCGRIALVALTGWGQPKDRDRTFEVGFDAHLVKPVTDRVLRDTLHRLIDPPDRTTPEPFVTTPSVSRPIG